MKAITLHQPWASFIVYGYKSIETRSWYTRYRGPLYIHAGANKQYLKYAPDILAEAGYVNVAIDYPLGAIIGCAFLDTVQQTEELVGRISHAEHTFGDYATGRWGFVLKDCMALAQPIPYKGALGLWEAHL